MTPNIKKAIENTARKHPDAFAAACGALVGGALVGLLLDEKTAAVVRDDAIVVGAAIGAAAAVKALRARRGAP